jgi:S-(hydroxymethyl)glutathione dehydrogenase/alcohol dehydrogenase
LIVGAAAREDRVTLPAASFLGEKILKGSAYGSSRPRVVLPRLIDLYIGKKLKLDELVTRTYPLDEVNQDDRAVERRGHPQCRVDVGAGGTGWGG